jgi:hypothetical protein
MSTLTGKDLNLVKPALTDDHKVTIGTDLPANFQKIDDEFTRHQAETVSDVDGAHGLKIEEGNWTPYLQGETTAGTWTAGSGNKGKYIKIHDRVFCVFLVQGTLTSAVGSLCLAGLPFTPTGSILSNGYITANNIATGLLGLLNSGNIIYPRIYTGGASMIDAATLSGEKFAYGVFEFNI